MSRPASACVSIARDTRRAGGSLALFGALLLLPLSLGCGEDPQLRGTVHDIWGKPIAGATVTLEGEVEQKTTDATGAFAFVAPKSEVRIMAGKDGYIRNAVTVPLKGSEQDEPDPIELSLYPDPGEVGFYAVGREKYNQLPAFEAVTKGTEVRAITGITDIGDSLVAQPKPLTFVFSSTLRQERIAQLDLKLHKLEFVQETTLPGVLGETTSDVNLWTATGEDIPYDLVGLPSKDDFLITLRQKLPAGAYAFHTQGALTNNSYGALDKLPRELRNAYVFEVR